MSKKSKNKEIVKGKSDTKVIDPTKDSGEDLLHYDYKCKNCGSSKIDIRKKDVEGVSEEVKEDIQEQYCKDCGGTDIGWGFSDMVLKCNSKVYNEETKQYETCGHVTKLKHPQFTNLRGGKNFPLYSTNKHFLGLACEKCGANIAIKFIPAENPPSEEAIEKMQKEQEDRMKPNKEIKSKLEVVKSPNNKEEKK
jgi:hypothetical protein